MATKPKRPRDPVQLAKLIGDIATGEVQEKAPDEKKSKGGRRGGQGRAEALTPDRRSAIASIAAQARWKKRK
jgi:hypothetical protein